MRSIALLLCLVTTLASAQQPDAPTASEQEPSLPQPITAPVPVEPAPIAQPITAPVPVEPAPVARPIATGPAEPAGDRAVRYSRYSAGEGGSTLVLTEALTGLISGAMLGSSLIPSEGSRYDGAYTGAVTGALVLGGASAVYQYFIPVERHESLLAAGAATVGLISGITAANAWGLDARGRAVLTLATTQAGVLGVLLLTRGEGDVSAGDAALVGMTSFYAFIVTGLVEYIHARESGQRFRFTPMLLAPAFGMALGGLLAIPLELPTASIRDITGAPLGAGLLALLIGAKLANDVTVAKTMLGAIAGTFALTVLFTALDEPAPQEAHATGEPQVVPVPVVMAAGRDNASLAAGPGLLMRF